jgi:hypothetical protein
MERTWLSGLILHDPHTNAFTLVSPDRGARDQRHDSAVLTLHINDILVCVTTSTPSARETGEAPVQADDAAMYSAVVARRLQWDSMLWQVPTLSLTGQAFLFTIALGADSSRWARIVACTLSIVMTILSMHLMSRHRQAEHTDAHWIEEYEVRRFGQSWHGRTWANHRNREEGSGLLARFKGFQVWMAGLSVFGLAAVVVLVLTAVRPSVLK